VEFAVRVEEAGSGALDHEARGPQVEHRGRAGERAAEESREEREGVQQADGRNGGEVEQAVIHAGVRGNISTVAVLVGVADGECEGAEIRPFPVVFDSA